MLYNSPISPADMTANATPELAQAGMDARMAWAKKNAESVVDLGMPLGSSRHIEAGSASPGSSQASGYSILQADSLESAQKMLEDHPHLHTPGGTIDVLEFLAVPGM